MEIKNERFLLLILASINFTHIVDFMIMMPLGPQLMRLLNISPQQFSLLVASYTFSAGISSFAASFFVDRFNRKHVLLFAYSGFLLGTLACALAPSYHFLMAARIFAGVFGGLVGAQVLAIVSDVVPYERRASAMGIIMSAFSFASVVGVPLGLFLSNKYNWHAPFYFVAALGFFIFALSARFIPNITSHININAIHKPFELIKNISQNPNQLRALSLMFVLMLGHFTIIPFIAPYMVTNVGFTEHQLTWIYLIGGFLTIFSSPLIGKLADKSGKFRVYTFFVLLSLIPVIAITNLGTMPVCHVLIITSLFFIISGGRTIPALAMISSVVKPHQRGGFMNINTSLQQLATGLASFMAGMIVSKGADGKLMHYNYVGYIAAIACVCTIFIAAKIKPADND